MWLFFFALVALLAYLVISLGDQGPQESVADRLSRLVKERGRSGLYQPAAPVPAPASTPADEAAPRLTPRQLLVGMVEKATTGRRFSDTLAVRLQRAGWKWKPAEFMLAQMVSSGTGLGVGVLVSHTLWWLFAVVGFALPRVLLSRSEKARLKLFDQQLPDALTMVSNALRSGFSFLQALDVVSREMPDPIAREFNLVLREARVNVPLEEALTHLTDRSKSADLDLVVTAVLIQRQVGGNLAEVLDKIGGTIKDRMRLQGEVRTLTTQGRMSGWIVSLLPVALAGIMQLVNPGYMTPMLTHPIGWALITIGILMQTIGILIIRNMVNLEV